MSLAPRQVAQVELNISSGTNATDAIRQSGILADVTDETVDSLQTGIWGRKCPHDAVLRDGDRIELYRPLKVDPKVARRERFSKQGVKSAGLFSKRRAGAKSGY